MTEEYPPETQEFPLELEDTWDLLLDYLLMCPDWPQNDTDVADYRAELEARGFLFITEYDDEATPLGEEGTIILRDPRTGLYSTLMNWDT